MTPFTPTDLTTAIGAEVLNGTKLPATFSGICTDSRQAKPGTVFWAIKGKRFDGHSFTDQAYACGVAAVVASADQAEHIVKRLPECPLFVVNDTTTALGRFGHWFRQQQDTLVIGVTGSVGKSTTRHMIHTVLSEQFRGCQSPRNFNNEIGVPLTLLELADEDEFAVLELAASATGDIDYLAGICEPEFGVVTAVGPCHLETFQTIQAIEETKGELIARLPQHGLAVLNGDDPRVLNMSRRADCRVITTGTQAHNDIRATEIECDNDCLRIRIDSERIRIPVSGRHYLPAVLAAYAIAREVGMDAESICSAFVNFEPLPGRCRIERIGLWTVINDCYNASPLSMRAACSMLNEWSTTGQRILVVGDMLELGGDAEFFHEQLGSEIGDTKIDYLLAYGEYAGAVAQGALHSGFASSRIGVFSNMEALLVVLSCWLKTGDVVTVKGSRGTRMERVIDWLRQAVDPSEFRANTANPMSKCA